MEVYLVKKAVNDATLNKAGDLYQYLVALRDCFELKEDETLQIELNGDVSILNKDGGLFQKEVKHHFGDKLLSDRDIDFWKTLANWYVDYDRVKIFSSFILCTTADISNKSSFYNWDNLDNEEKLNRVRNIGKVKKEREKAFREQYDRIFSDSYNEQKLIYILEKLKIESSHMSIVGISREFSKYILPIPEENRDGYIGALLGRLMKKVTVHPYKWEITKKEFEQLCQIEAAAYGVKGAFPLPIEYKDASIPQNKIENYVQKKFVYSIREIQYEEEIPNAMSDYWKTDLTIIKYFRDNPIYLESLEEYRHDLSKRLIYIKKNKDINALGKNSEEIINMSKIFYNEVILWEAKDFGSIIKNRDYFQHGVIHNIVDETDFKWKVGDDKDEHI